MFFRSQTPRSKDSKLTKLLHELYAFESSTYVYQSGRYRRAERIITICNDVSTHVLFFLGVYSFVDSRLHCASQDEMIIPGTDVVVANVDGDKVLPNFTVLNQLKHSFTAERRRLYDYNNNGIYNEPGENEVCTQYMTYFWWVLFCFTVFFFLNRFVQLESRCEANVYRKNALSRKNYDTLYDEVTEIIIELENKFQSLSDEQKIELFHAELADKNNNGEIIPKLEHSCPMTFSLMTWPLITECIGETSEKKKTVFKSHYDMRFFLPSLKPDNLEPYRRLPMSSYYFDKEFNEKHINYLQALDDHVEAMLPKPK